MQLWAYGKCVTAADFLTLDLALPATRLVVWQCARATPLCPVEASIPTSSVTATVPSSWRLSLHMVMGLLGEFNADTVREKS